MTFRGIDKKRFEYLLNLGADDDELRRFFSESRTQLIQQGGKVQNLPQGNRARVRTLAFELPDTTQGAVGAWFKKNLTMADPAPITEILEEFKLHEELAEPMAEASARRLARSCIVHLFSDSPPEDLLTFLRSTIGGGKEPRVDEKHVDGPTAIQDQEAEQRERKSAALDILPDLITNLLEGQDVEALLAEYPPQVATYCNALQAAMKGDLDEARRLASALEGESRLWIRLDAYLTRAEIHRSAGVAMKRGVQASAETDFSGELDETHDGVLGYCTNSDKPSAVFVRPLAIIRSDQVLRLRGGDAERIFPDTGDLISFAGNGRPPQPTRGELGVWQVARHDTDKKTRFHLASEKRWLYEVHAVPFASSDPDSVRAYLLMNARQQQSNPSIYELSDGLIVASRAERPDLTKEDAYEMGLRAWVSLPGVRIEGRLFVFGPLPQEHSTFECASLAVIARSLLQARPTQSGAVLTKTQLREVARLVEEEKGSRTAQRLARLAFSLEEIADNIDAMEALSLQALALPEIRERIDKAVSEEVSRRLKEKQDLANDIERLNKERRQADERLQRLRDEQKKLRDETTKTVRAAFERAKNEGMPKLLAEAAIFDALGNQKPDTLEVRMHSDQPTPRQQWRRLEVTSGDQPEEVLKKFGCSKQKAAAFAVLASAILGSGLVLAIRGAYSRALVQAWAAAGGVGSRVAVLDGSLGMINSCATEAMLGETPRLDTILLTDANLSDLEIFARPLVDATVLRLSGLSGDPLPQIVITLSDSVAALPLARGLLQLTVQIDLDIQCKSIADLGPVEQLFDSAWEQQAEAVAELWPVAAKGFISRTQQLDPEKLALALSLLLPQQGAQSSSRTSST